MHRDVLGNPLEGMALLEAQLHAQIVEQRDQARARVQELEAQLGQLRSDMVVLRYTLADVLALPVSGDARRLLQGCYATLLSMESKKQ